MSDGVTTTSENEQSGPHIPTTQGAVIEIQGHPVEFFVGSTKFEVTTTIFSTWIFMAILFVLVAVLNIAMRTKALPRIRAFGVDVVTRIDTFFADLLGDKKYARRFLPLVGSFFVFIFLGNLLGLAFDYISMVIPALHEYLRPINSDMNTTVAMALSIVIVAQATGIIIKGPVHHFGHYLFNFSGHSFIEKCISVFVGWIHLVGEFARIVSLSVRLFGNIFAGVILISVFGYIATLIPVAGNAFGIIFVLPFWFFELMVAFLQAFIFMTLSGIYLKEGFTKESH